MRKFSVTVNGATYEVEIEEVTNSDAASVVGVAPRATSTPTPKAVASKTTVATGATAIKSPFPGTILKVNVSAGQTVKSGDILMVIEAMKMENEIRAPKDGVVASVNVSKGAAVATDDLLASLK